MSDSSLSFISVEVCRRLIDIPQVVQRIEEVYRWEIEGDVVHLDPDALRIVYSESSYKSHTKAVILPKLSVAGVRIVGYRVHEDGSGPSSPDSTRLVVLSDLNSGRPLAIVDEHYNYTLRTAASVGVAAKYLSPAKPTLGLIGVGGVGRGVARIFSQILPLQEICITSRQPSSRQAFIETLEPELKVSILAVESIEEVLDRCNVVVTATTSREILVQWSQVRPGTLLCALGSNELEPEVYRRATKVLVDSWEQTQAAHDMKPILDSQVFTREHLYAELGEVVTGRTTGRDGEDEVIVVRTEGMISQDVALAHWVYEEAKRLQLNTVIVE